MGHTKKIFQKINKKLPKKLSYEKRACKMLMKLTADDKNESFRQNSEDLKVCTGQEVLVKYEQEGLVPFVGKKLFFQHPKSILQ